MSVTSDLAVLDDTGVTIAGVLQKYHKIPIHASLEIVSWCRMVQDGSLQYQPYLALYVALCTEVVGPIGSEPEHFRGQNAEPDSKDFINNPISRI